jgi:O-methyltransferase involved in polyketide biosynthesis
MTEKIALTKEKETLLITLYAKAGESRLPDTLLHDEDAADAVSRIDYDFSKLKVDRNLMIGVAMRAKIFDDWTRDFIAAHPDATVLHLGCGLDTRVFRVDPPASVLWFDVDYPEIVALRRRLFAERDGYTMLGASVTDPRWLEAVPRSGPTLILAEGLLMYLAPDDAPRLLDRLTAHFTHGEIAFDAFSRLGVRLVQRQRSVRATGATLYFSLDDPHDLEKQIPRLELVTAIRAYDPKGYDPRQIARMTWASALAVRLFAAIPLLGNMSRLLRYRF